MKFNSTPRKYYYIVILFFACMYAFFAASAGPAFGDDLSFTVAAMKGFDWATNATNHFLYINVMHGLYLFFEWLSPGSSGRVPFLLMSLIPGLMVLGYLFEIFKVLKVSRWVSGLVVAAFAFSFTFWRHNEIVEVYALNLALNAQIFLWFVKWNQQRDASYLLKAAFLLGVAMLVHVQNVLLLPFLAFWMYSHSGWKLKEYVGPALAFLVPSSILVIIPMVSGSNSLSSILFDNSFQDEVLGFQLSVLAKGFAKAIGYLLFNFGVFAVLFAVASFKKNLVKEVRIGLLLVAIPVFAFAARYNVSDNYVFFLPCYLALAVMSGPYLQQFWKDHMRYKIIGLAFIAMVPIGYAVLPKIALMTQKGQELHQQKWYKGGVYFFLWPGMSKNPGARDLIRSIDSGRIDAEENLEIEQNAQNARDYLQLMEQQVH